MQKSLSTLTERRQAHRMMQLAHEALDAYAVHVKSVTALKQVYNKNFHISGQDGKQYMLRICHPRRTSVEAVRSELLWLAALNQDTNLIVPIPVLNREAQYVTSIADADLPGTRLCVLFHWINGRFLYRTLTPSHLFQIGELMARLQLHAQHWISTSWFYPAECGKPLLLASGTG